MIVYRVRDCYNNYPMFDGSYRLIGRYESGKLFTKKEITRKHLDVNVMEKINVSVVDYWKGKKNVKF